MEAQALEEGILNVAIGKYGSKEISYELAEKILKNFNHSDISPILKGAFLGALFLKGFQSEGEKLIQKELQIFSAEDILSNFCNSHQENKVLLTKLLNYQNLNYEEAYHIGKFLFSNEVIDSHSFDFEIGLISTILRFRYETHEEYCGLYKAIEELYFFSWNKKIKEDHRFIIITEPFDGLENNYFYTPLLGKMLIEKGWIPFFIVSDNPGPKNNFNLKDLAISLNSKFIEYPEQIEENLKNISTWQKEDFYGFFIDNRNLSPVFEKWIRIRKLLKKRPFLSTLERIINPVNAKIQIFSAYHPAYLEKVTEILKYKSIPIIIGIRRGEEGSLTFSFNKKYEVMISKKLNNYESQQEFFYEAILEKKNQEKTFLEDNHCIIESIFRSQNLDLPEYLIKQIENQKKVFSFIINFL